MVSCQLALLCANVLQCAGHPYHIFHYLYSEHLRVQEQFNFINTVGNQYKRDRGSSSYVVLSGVFTNALEEQHLCFQMLWTTPPTSERVKHPLSFAFSPLKGKVTVAALQLEQQQQQQPTRRVSTVLSLV